MVPFFESPFFLYISRWNFNGVRFAYSKFKLGPSIPTFHPNWYMFLMWNWWSFQNCRASVQASNNKKCRTWNYTLSRNCRTWIWSVMRDPFSAIPFLAESWGLGGDGWTCICFNAATNKQSTAKDSQVKRWCRILHFSKLANIIPYPTAAWCCCLMVAASHVKSWAWWLHQYDRCVVE